ncbi:hypothetical protein GGR57DRAFT_417424 [Xylariaceae sp. FL1272]|nr:hypothetical protein GGR57DRAFT_417424 [Xylariaceae sp. FL1272]
MDMPSHRPVADSHEADCPDESTSLGVAQERRNYQATQTSSNLRSRQPPSRPEPDTARQNGNSSLHTSDEKGWLAACLDGIWSIELENKGSVARDHLALERTFLAWLRTSLSFASIGIAITQLFRLNTAISDDAHLAPLRHIGRPLVVIIFIQPGT